jgi:hypothetical protein
MATPFWRSIAGANDMGARLYTPRVGTYLPSNTDRERPVLPISVLNDWHFASEKAPWAIQDLVRMAMVCGSVRMRRAFVGVAMRHVARDNIDNRSLTDLKVSDALGKYGSSTPPARTKLEADNSGVTAIDVGWWVDHVAPAVASSRIPGTKTPRRKHHA